MTRSTLCCFCVNMSALCRLMKRLFVDKVYISFITVLLPAAVFISNASMLLTSFNRNNYLALKIFVKNLFSNPSRIFP